MKKICTFQIRLLVWNGQATVITILGTQDLEMLPVSEVDGLPKEKCSLTRIWKKSVHIIWEIKKQHFLNLII